jgi:hypothetical protein
MKKSNELNEEEIKAIKERFKKKHNRSILFQRNDIFGCFKKFNLFKRVKSFI